MCRRLFALVQMATSFLPNTVCTRISHTQPMKSTCIQLTACLHCGSPYMIFPWVNRPSTWTPFIDILYLPSIKVDFEQQVLLEEYLQLLVSYCALAPQFVSTDIPIATSSNRRPGFLHSSVSDQRSDGRFRLSND